MQADDFDDDGGAEPVTTSREFIGFVSDRRLCALLGIGRDALAVFRAQVDFPRKNDVTRKTWFPAVVAYFDGTEGASQFWRRR